MSYPVTLIPGDGIGPEVSHAARRAIDATGVTIDWEIAELNSDLILKTGQSLPQNVLVSLDRTRVGLKGPVSTPIAGGFSSVNVALRKKLDLYANVRPVRSLPGIASRFSDVQIDMVIFRENTEDLYSGIEHEVVPDVVTGIKVITRTIVDNAAMQLVMRPEEFDVLLLPNLYGDIVSDLCAGLVGGLGIVPGANMGDTHAVFEAVHGSAPDIAGKGIANPTAMMLCGVLMLTHLKELGAANRLQGAIEAVYAAKKHTTGDVGGQSSTEEFTGAVIAALK